jgi:hypothetical protein
MGTGSSYTGVKRPGRELTKHLHLVPRLRMRGALPQFPQYVLIALCFEQSQLQHYLHRLRRVRLKARLSLSGRHPLQNRGPKVESSHTRVLYDLIITHGEWKKEVVGKMSEYYEIKYKTNPTYQRGDALKSKLTLIQRLLRRLCYGLWYLSILHCCHNTTDIKFLQQTLQSHQFLSESG